jgi:hypothetical protein
MKRDVKKPEKTHWRREGTCNTCHRIKGIDRMDIEACSKYVRERGSQHTEKSNASEKSMLGQKKEKLAALSEQ